MGTQHEALVMGRDKMTRILDDSLDKVNEIWNRVGFTDDVRRERIEVVITHFQSFVNQMMEGEENMEKTLRANVQKFSEELHELCSELKVKPISIDPDLPLITREQEIRANALSLRREKRNRLDKWYELSKTHQYLCSRLAIQSPYVKDVVTPTEECHEPAPSAEKLEILQADVHTKQKLVTERMDYLAAMRKTIREQYKRMRIQPTTDLEQRLISSDDAIPLSDATMEGLDALEKDLEVKLAQYLIRVQSEIEKCREEIRQLWDDCCVSQKEREAFPFLDDRSFSEDLLERHLLEVDRLKSMYESKREILDLLRQWKDLFQKLVIFEERANDPARFTNRGGTLLREEKERKAVQKHLPEVEAELSKLVSQWEEANGEKVYIEGRPFLEHLATEKLEYSQRKEEERQERLQRKQVQKHEQMFGTVPGKALPARRS